MNAQIMKGILEGCILKIVDQSETYGYEICEKLVALGFESQNEGSVYPILIRLEKKSLLASVTRKSPYGPNRKYYRLTGSGKAALSGFIESWNSIRVKVDQIIQEK